MSLSFDIIAGPTFSISPVATIVHLTRYFLSRANQYHIFVVMAAHDTFLRNTLSPSVHSVRAHWRRNSRTFLPLLVLSILVLSLFYLRGEQSVVWDPATGPASTKGTNTPIDPNVPLIPPKIWQIFFPPNSYKRDDRFNTGVDPSLLGDTVSWLVKNPKYEYVLVGNKYGDDFVDKHYPNSRVGQIYHLLRNPGLKSDLLRYMILAVEGGVYTDIDTFALEPIDKWVPADMKDRVKLIVGVEFDQRDGGRWAEITHVVQFCQWTIAAAPGHPIFTAMMERAVESLEELSLVHNTGLDTLKPSSFEVVNSTGPAAWTDIVVDQVHGFDPSVVDSKDLSWLTEPKLYGDILVLPISGFGWGQTHSGSVNDGTFPESALLQHKFKGSWRHSAD